MQKLVTVIVPAYNAEKWIRDCIESALDQTWLRTEVIVIDDGSTDNTLEIAKSFVGRKVEVRSQDNQGVCVARNHALSIAQGDYIQWLDADDVLAPDKIEAQMIRAESDSASKDLYSGPWGKFFYLESKARFEPSSLWEDLTPIDWLYRKLNDNAYMIPESFIISRELTELAGPWDETLFRDTDGDYMRRVVAETEFVHFVPDAESFHRIGVRGISHDLTLNDRKLDSIVKSVKSSIATIREIEDSPRVRDACLTFVQRWSFYVYPERMDLWDELETLMGQLGGQLREPALRNKFSWLRHIIGYKNAKKAQAFFPALKSDVVKQFERLVARREKAQRRPSCN